MKELDEMMKLVDEPKKVSKPSNAGLWLSLVFFNLVALVVEGISGGTIGYVTGFWYYGVVAFLAGFIPLGLNEILYVRAYANETQRKISIWGAAISIASIVLVAIGAAVINIGGYADAALLEIVTVVGVVLIACLHGGLMAFYFYADDGVKATHRKTAKIGRHQTRLDDLEMAEEVMAMLRKAQARRAGISKKYGRADVLDKIVQQLSGDDDGDGIPNYRDPDYRPAYAQTVQTPPNAPKPVTNFTLEDLEKRSKLTADEVGKKFTERKPFKAWVVEQFEPDYVSGDNLEVLWRATNPTNGGTKKS